MKSKKLPTGWTLQVVETRDSLPIEVLTFKEGNFEAEIQYREGVWRLYCVPLGLFSHRAPRLYPSGPKHEDVIRSAWHVLAETIGTIRGLTNGLPQLRANQ